MDFNLNVDPPTIWFVCTFCREAFPDIDTLKQHKVGTHFEDWVKIRCVVFEETLYQQPWTPLPDNIYPKQNPQIQLFKSEIIPDVATCQCSRICPLHTVSVKNQTPSQVIQDEKEQQPKTEPNPFVLLNRLTCLELNNALKGNSSNFIGKATRSLRKRKLAHNYSLKQNNTPAAAPAPKKKNTGQIIIKNESESPIFEEILGNLQPPLDFDDDLKSDNSDSDFEPDPLYPQDLDDIPFIEEVEVEITETDHGHNTPLIEWLSCQKQRHNQQFQTNEESRNVIVIDPDPTLTPNDPFEINSYNPVTCKLCQTKLTTDERLRNHVENCWLHNKLHHRYCVPCDEAFMSHRSAVCHNASKHVPLECRTDDGHGDESCDLPLVDWLIKEKEDPKNVVLLQPDLTLRANSNYVISQSSTIKCVLCQAQLTSDSLLKNHVRTCWHHNKPRHVHCVPCNKTLRSRQMFRKHEKFSDIHFKNINSVFRCRVCTAEFATKSELNYHQQSLKKFLENKRLSITDASSKKSQDEDPEDNVSRNTEAALYDWLQLQQEVRHAAGTENVILIDPQPREGHLVEVNEENHFTCRLCSKKHMSVRQVKLHVNCYLQNRRRHVYCVPCKKGFGSPKKLRHHKSLEHSEENTASFKCKFCNKEFVDEKVFENHEKAHKDPNFKPFSCPQCPARLKSKKTLDAHMIVHGKLTDFVCRFCSQCFNRRFQLEIHERLHTGERPYSCTVANCDLTFSSRLALKIHEGKNHVQELGLAEHLCPSCGRTFGVRFLLNRHMKHCVEKAHRCTHEGCTKAFSFNSKLVEHMRKHTGETPFQCDECGTAFALSGSFLKHKQTHEGTRNKSKCHLCPKSFLGTWELKKHVKKAHASSK